jgi:hypothetical protein
MTTTKRRKFMGPLASAEWHTGIAYAYEFIDEEVAGEMAVAGIPRNPSGEFSGMAEYAALARVADRKVAEYVAYARRNRQTWEWIGTRLGVTPQAAQQRFGKLPAPPLALSKDHRDEDCITVHLRRDKKGWGCKCGAFGKLD